MKLSTKIILPIILISALLILLNGCFGVPSPGYTPETGTITGIIAAPCCSTSAESVSEICCVAPEYWCFYCQENWSLQDGIEVVLTYGEDEIATTTTNENGEYTFTDVDSGKNYVVTAYCPDFGDNRPLVKDVALEFASTFDTGITDLVSTSLGLVVDFLVLYTEWGPEDISLDEVLADRPNFPNFPKFKKLVYEVRRVVENCEVNLLTDDEVQDALCRAAEEISKLEIGCGPGYTPPPPEPDPCDGNTKPDITLVEYDKGSGFSPVDPGDVIHVIVGQIYTIRVTATDDTIKDPLTYSGTVNGDPFGPISSNQITVTPDEINLIGYSVSLSVYDGCDPNPWGAVTVVVHDECFENVAPVITLPVGSPFAIDPNTLKTWNFTVTDDNIKPGALSVTASISPTPNTPGNFDYTFNYTTKEGTITWTPECEDLGETYTITVEAGDGCVTVSDNFEVTLNTEPCACFGNADPVITLPVGSPFAIDPNTLKTWNFTVTDDNIKPGALSVTASISPTPNTPGNFDYTFNYTTKEGTITWTPECEDLGETYTITVEAGDGCVTVSDNFEVTLNTEPCACFGNADPVITLPVGSPFAIDPNTLKTWNFTVTDDNIKPGALSVTASISPTPNTPGNFDYTFNYTTKEGTITWTPECEDLGETYTITVEAGDGCVTVSDNFEVTLNTEPCLCTLSLQVKEGGEEVEYLDELLFTTTVSENITYMTHDDITVETNASKLWFRICASPNAEVVYNFYRGGSCPDIWEYDDLSGNTPPGWSPVLDSKFNSQYYPDGYPNPSPDDLIICNTGDPNEPVNILMVKVTEGSLITIYTFNIFR